MRSRIPALLLLLLIAAPLQAAESFTLHIELAGDTIRSGEDLRLTARLEAAPGTAGAFRFKSFPAHFGLYLLGPDGPIAPEAKTNWMHGKGSAGKSVLVTPRKAFATTVKLSDYFAINTLTPGRYQLNLKFRESALGIDHSLDATPVHFTVVDANAKVSETKTEPTVQPDPLDQLINDKGEIDRDALRKLIDNAPVPKGNVRVTIERLEVDDDDETVRRLLLRQPPRHSMRTGHFSAQNGILFYPASRTLTLNLPQGRKTSSYTKQFLVMLPGSESMLQVIREQTRVWTAVIPVWHGKILTQTLEERVTGTGMFVKIHAAGPTGVDVELAPAFHRAEKKGWLRVEEIATRVILTPGVPYVLTAHESRSTTFGGAFFLHTHGGRRTRVVQTIRVDLDTSDTPKKTPPAPSGTDGETRHPTSTR